MRNRKAQETCEYELGALAIAPESGAMGRMSIYPVLLPPYLNRTASARLSLIRCKIVGRYDGVRLGGRSNGESTYPEELAKRVKDGDELNIVLMIAGG